MPLRAQMGWLPLQHASACCPAPGAAIRRPEKRCPPHACGPGGPTRSATPRCRQRPTPVNRQPPYARPLPLLGGDQPRGPRTAATCSKGSCCADTCCTAPRGSNTPNCSRPRAPYVAPTPARAMSPAARRLMHCPYPCRSGAPTTRPPRAPVGRRSIGSNTPTCRGLRAPYFDACPRRLLGPGVQLPLGPLHYPYPCRPGPLTTRLPRARVGGLLRGAHTPTRGGLHAPP